MNDDHDDGEGHSDDQVFEAWKIIKRKIKRLKAKVYLIGFFCFGDQDT